MAEYLKAREKRACDLRKGDLVYSNVTDMVSLVQSVDVERKGSTFIFLVRHQGGLIRSMLADDKIQTAVQVPVVGDLCTLTVGSDCYPYTVAHVSPTGKSLKILRLTAKVTAGTFQTGDAKVQYGEAIPGSDRVANFAPSRGRYTVNGTPLSIGHARYYQDPSF